MVIEKLQGFKFLQCHHLCWKPAELLIDQLYIYSQRYCTLTIPWGKCLIIDLQIKANCHGIGLTCSSGLGDYYCCTATLMHITELCYSNIYSLLFIKGESGRAGWRTARWVSCKNIFLTPYKSVMGNILAVYCRCEHPDDQIYNKCYFGLF